MQPEIGTYERRIDGAPIRRWINALLFAFALLSVTIYIFLNARNDYYADFFLLTLLALSLPRCLNFQQGLVFSEDNTLLFIWGYMALAVASVLFPPSSYTSLEWIIKSFYRIIVVFLIVKSLRVHGGTDLKMLSWLIPFLTVMLSVAIILDSLGVANKQQLHFLTPWHVVETIGNNKYFSFHLLFLMWTAIAFLWGRGFIKTILATGIFILSLIALLSSSSESAQIACLAGLGVFGLCHISFTKGRYWVYLLVFSLMLIIPFLWVVFGPIMSEDPWVVFRDTESFLRKHWNIGVRLFMNDVNASFVHKEMVLGHGFGSTLSIPVPSGTLPGHEILPGGHPHNIFFLFLIEHGLLGFVWLSTMFFMLFDYLYHATIKRKEGPAVWALAISGQIVFSLSFSIWHPDVVLTYGMFFILLMLAVGFPDPGTTIPRRQRLVKFAQSIIILAVAGYGIDEFILSAH